MAEQDKDKQQQPAEQKQPDLEVKDDEAAEVKGGGPRYGAADRDPKGLGHS
jgi:hypothetical protein